MIRRALLAGTMAGFLVGAGDACAAWGRMSQFVPGAGGKLRAALLAGTLLALAGALVVAPLVAGGAALLRYTVLGRLVAHARAQHEVFRARDPREALIGLSLVIAGLPVLGAALAVAYQIGFVTISTRKHKGLVVAVTMLATLGALAAAVVLTLAMARGVEAALRRLLRGRALAAASHVLAPPGAAAALVVLGAAVAYVALGKKLALDQLALRPFVVALLVPLGAAAAWPAAGRVEARIAKLPRAARLAAAPALLLLLFLAALGLGAGDGARKAATAYTGLSGPVANGLRRAVDLDRDGYSPLFGGGDCNDFDRDVHPGAFDAPDDGVDQNCMGGDLRLSRAATDTQFVTPPASVPRDANILLLTIDTLRSDHVGAYGYARATTPTLDAIAAEGALFQNGWAHAPSTRYSMPAILTGRYPSQVLWDTSVWWPALRPENHTIAEILHEAGFHTGAILNYGYFDRVRRMDQGFDDYDNEDARLHQGRDPAATSGTSSREQSDKAIAYIDAHAGERFFLWVHYYDPHFQYEHHPGTQEFGPEPQDLYDHEIRFTDEQIARVVADLEQRGLWDKTIVVVTGDHGEGFGEHHIDFHGYHLYAAQTKVPFIVRVPGVAARKVTMPVGHVDILPTLANLAGAPAESTMLGRSLVGEIAGLPGHDPDADREVFQEVSFEGPTERRAAVNQRYHLLYNMVPDNTWELYDLAQDPRETRDVWGAAADAASHLREQLLSWIDASQFPPGTAEKLATALLKARPTPQVAAPADFGGKVRLLGYDLPAAEVHPGSAFDITYLFESLGTLAGDWRLFVHVEGPTRFQDDHYPVDGALPFSRWRRGQFVADARHVTVPASARPGEYTIYVGLWQPRKGNLGVANAGERDAGNNRVRLGTLRVVP